MLMNITNNTQPTI